MSEQLKQQTLYDVAEANIKNLIWVDVYVSGTEGSSGVYASRRMTLNQFLTYLNGALTFPVDGSGTANKISKWSDSNTLTDSIINDNGSVIGIGVAVDTTIKAKIANADKLKTLYVENTNASGTHAIHGKQIGDGGTTSTAIGVLGEASGGADFNYGTQGTSSGVGAVNVGVFGSASGASQNYAVKLQDGTQAVGKFLKCLVSTGEGSWATLAISDVTNLQTSLDAKSDKNLTLNRQTASYTLVATDNGKLIEMNVASANNVTINNSLFSAGNQIVVAQYGAGQVSFVAGAGVTIRSASGKLKLTGQYSMATIIAISATEFYLAGDLTA